MHDSILLDDVRATTQTLLAYCQANDWAGYDPYDALNSRLLRPMRVLDSRLPRIVLTQLLKRSPLNLRRLMFIPKTHNPKAIALFLTSSLKLSGLRAQAPADPVMAMVQKLIDLRSPSTPYWCWGYSFPWQTRTILVPRGAPNLVCTSFVANALLDAYEQRGDARCLAMATSAAEYLLNELYWADGDLLAGFSYPLPSLHTQVHNANFLAAALLCRVYKHTSEPTFLAPALRAARVSAARQHEDGSWVYGEAPTQQWIDNFHTGYNLCALQAIGRYAETTEFESCIRRGFEFYRSHFLRADGAARYFHDRTYPVDIHCVAQTIITLLTLRDLAEDSLHLASSVYRWAMAHMWDGQGYFHYQIRPFWTTKISYMRWSQAWMLLALATLLAKADHSGLPTGVCNASSSTQGY